MRRITLRELAVACLSLVFTQPFVLAAAFKGAATFPAHLGPQSIVVADFNGDGNLDIAIANRTSNDVSILLGKGNGTFNPQVKYSAGAGTDPVAIAAADFNGDGKPDLVVANSGNNSISVLMNNGTGAFAAPVKYGVSGLPTAVAVGDVSGDGIADIAVTTSSNNNVAVFFNNGSGAFAIHGNFGTDGSPHSVVIADFNGDGANDLAVANQSGNDVSILFNQGSGTFATAVNYCVVAATGACNAGGSVNPLSLVAVDLNGDGKQDLAVASSAQSVVTLLNNGSGVFTLTAQSSGSNEPQAIAAGDFNKDGFQDLVVADGTANSFEIFNGNGTGNLGSPLRYLSGNGPISIASGDFNKDGKLDVAVVNVIDNNVAVILGNGDGTFQDIAGFVSGSNVRSIAIGDFNKDGKIDFLANSSSNGNFFVNLFTGNGKGLFAEVASVALAADVNSIATGDFNQDKNLDFVVANQAANQVSVVAGNGNGTFNPSVATYSTDTGPASVAVGDLNKDGYPDIVTANPSANDISVLLNTKTGTFNAAVNYPTGTSPVSVVVTDLNNDGFPDIVTANSGSNNISVFMNNGNGTFAGAVTYTVGNGPASVAAALLNGDIFPDLIVTNKTDNSVSVLLGNGDGTLQAAVAYTVPGSGPVAAIGADITADGIRDLVIAENTTNSVGVMPGNGDGTFQGSINYKIGVGPVAVAAGDVSGDGKVDVLAGNFGSGDVSVLINQSPAAAMSASATKLTFGNVQVSGSSAPQSVTLTNKGNTILNIGSITTSADYGMSTTCGSTLASQGTCTITITFSPTYPGLINGELTITGSVTGDFLIVPLTGTGQFPMAVLPLTLTFPATPVGGTSAGQTVTVTNQTSSSISFNFSTTGNYNVTGSGATPCNGTLAALANCTVSVSLSPTQSGPISGSFIVSGNGFLPQITSLSGTGTGGSALPLSFSPANLLFDSPALGFSSLPKTVTATNTSGGPLTLALTASTDWSVSGTGTKPCGGTLGTGATCQFAVVFTPSITGYFNGSISVNTGSGNPVIYDLEGLGNLDSSFSPSSMTFAPQAVGTTSPGQVVKVWNFENSNMTILGWAASGDFTAVPGGAQPCSVNGQVPPLLLPFCNLVVYFTPTKTGAISGAISVTTSWATGSESFPVNGTGQ
ncbi:MAG TPA: FG-GAP-like repeat-containing protein [Candidatus Sulfotelmatobacter sp.]